MSERRYIKWSVRRAIDPTSVDRWAAMDFWSDESYEMVERCAQFINKATGDEVTIVEHPPPAPPAPPVVQIVELEKYAQWILLVDGEVKGAFPRLSGAGAYAKTELGIENSDIQHVNEKYRITKLEVEPVGEEAKKPMRTTTFWDSTREDE